MAHGIIAAASALKAFTSEQISGEAIEKSESAGSLICDGRTCKIVVLTLSALTFLGIIYAISSCILCRKKNQDGDPAVTNHILISNDPGESSIARIKGRFHYFLESLSAGWSGRTRLEIVMEKKIPLLQARLDELKRKIRLFEEIVKKDPQLAKKCEEAWEKFKPHAVPVRPIDESSNFESPIDQVAHLQRKILNCRTVIEDYRRVLRENPQLLNEICQQLRSFEGEENVNLLEIESHG